MSLVTDIANVVLTVAFYVVAIGLVFVLIAFAANRKHRRPHDRQVDALLRAERGKCAATGTLGVERWSHPLSSSPDGASRRQP